MATIFTKIITGEIPAHKILEDENYLAFLDLRPVNPGHTLVIPKKEIDYVFDLEDSLLSGLTLFAKKVARAIKLAFPCKKVGIAVVGIEVPHTHIHLIPLNAVGDLDFKRAKSATQEELASAAEKIKANLA